MKKIVHFTSVHKRYDTRIFLKQCVSLACKYDVYLIVADGLGDEVKLNVKIIDVGRSSSSRLRRMIKTTSLIYTKALSIVADLYHFHDPELLPVGLKLKNKTNAKVIFDSHEDVPKQILGKPYLNGFLRFSISRAYSFYQDFSCKKLDLVIAPTPSIREGFEFKKIKSVEVRNYPLVHEFSNSIVDWRYKSPRVCYVGGLEEDRGLLEMLGAITLVKNNCTLSLGGNFSSNEFEMAAKKSAGWSLVDNRGWLDRNSVNDLLTDSMAGLVTLRPAINFIESLPVKMFEYMAAGLPVIASDFPLWKEIIDKEKCGICVQPLSSVEISKAIDYFLENPKIAEQMGKNGRKAVLEKYNWTSEAKKLLKIYSSLLY